MNFKLDLMAGCEFPVLCVYNDLSSPSVAVNPKCVNPLNVYLKELIIAFSGYSDDYDGLFEGIDFRLNAQFINNFLVYVLQASENNKNIWYNTPATIFYRDIEIDS